MFSRNEDGSVNILTEYAKVLLQGVIDDAKGNPADAAEGKRLSEELRKSFPDVSDHDMGSIVMIFTQVLINLTENRVTYLPYLTERTAMIYAHCGAELLKTVIEFGEM